MDKTVNDLGQAIPRNTLYALVVECDQDLAVQYTRVDTTQQDLALMSVIL